VEVASVNSNPNEPDAEDKRMSSNPNEPDVVEDRMTCDSSHDESINVKAMKGDDEVVRVEKWDK
jgi:hypothetical protein